MFYFLMSNIIFLAIEKRIHACSANKFQFKGSCCLDVCFFKSPSLINENSSLIPFDLKPVLWYN